MRLLHRSVLGCSAGSKPSHQWTDLSNSAVKAVLRAVQLLGSLDTPDTERLGVDFQISFWFGMIAQNTRIEQ